MSSPMSAAAAFALVAAAAAVPTSGGKIGLPRQLLDEQTNSSGYPWRPHFPAAGPWNEIVGGEIINPPHQFPFLTSLQRNWPANPGPFCGGSLVAPNFILTAAHCTEGFSPSDLTVLINWDDVQNTNPAIGEPRQISAIVDHPDYDWRTLENDVSLLYFEEPSTYRPAEIDNGAWSQVGQVGPVAGWGRINNGFPSEFPDRPHSVPVPVVSNEQCNSPPSYPGQVTDDMICAGETGKCSCNGDSGGPMFTEVEDGLDFITGVVSWGAGECGAPDKFGVYARVSWFKDWIMSYIEPDSPKLKALLEKSLA